MWKKTWKMDSAVKWAMIWKAVKFEIKVLRNWTFKMFIQMMAGGLKMCLVYFGKQYPRFIKRGRACVKNRNLIFFFPPVPHNITMSATKYSVDQ